VLDFTLVWSLNDLKEFANSRITKLTKFIGFSQLLTAWTPIMEEWCGWMREKWPHLVFIAGAPAPPPYESKQLDYYISGYGEEALVVLLKYLFSNGPRPIYDLSISTEKKIISADKNYKAFPYPKLTILYENRDYIRPEEWIAIETSRGCIFKCDFCSYPLNGKKSNEYIKYKNVLHREFLSNYEQYGIRHYIVSDDTFNDNLDKLRMMAEISQSLPFDLKLSCYIRIDLVRAHPEQYQLFKDIGLVGAFFGIESLNHASLKSIGKGLHPDKLIQELYTFRDQLPDCGTMGSFIAGLPYETKQSLDHFASVTMDHDFPIDVLRIDALTMNSKRKHNQSEFEKNSSKYFTLDPSKRDELGHEFWHNGDFDISYAKDFCANFIKELQRSKRNRVGGFQVISLQNYYPDRPIAHLPLSQTQVPLEMQQAKLAKYKQLVFNNVTDVF